MDVQTDQLVDVQQDPLAQENAPMNLSPTGASVPQATDWVNQTLWSKQLASTIFVGLTIVFLVSVIYQPATADPNGNYFSICGFKNLTGLPCPGCGLTHSFCEIGKGHFQSALSWNWLGIPLFALFILAWLKAIFILTRRFDWALGLDKLAARIKPLRWFAIAFAVYGVGRMIYILLHKPPV